LIFMNYHLFGILFDFMKKMVIKRVGFAIFLIFLVFLPGCWVEVKDENTSFQEVDSKTRVLSPQRDVFWKFKEACEQEDWKRAYSMLSSRWQESRPLEGFVKNMQQVGKEHLKGARIDTIVQSMIDGKEKWAITAVNFQKQSTMYVFIEENGIWKIDGVKNLQ